MVLEAVEHDFVNVCLSIVDVLISFFRAFVVIGIRFGFSAL